MVNSQQCPACGSVGWVGRTDRMGRPVSWCRTAWCDVVEYDRDVILTKRGVLALPSVPPGARRLPRARAAAVAEVSVTA
jgi:hypothetical protein